MLEILLILRPGGVRGIPEGAVKYVTGNAKHFQYVYSAIISGGPSVAKAPN